MSDAHGSGSWGFWETNYGKTADQVCAVLSLTVDPERGRAELKVMTELSGPTVKEWERAHDLRVNLLILPGAPTQVVARWVREGEDIEIRAPFGMLGLRAAVSKALTEIAAKMSPPWTTQRAANMSECVKIGEALAVIPSGQRSAHCLNKLTTPGRRVWLGRRQHWLSTPTTYAVLLHDNRQRSECEEGLIANAVRRRFADRDVSCIVSTVPAVVTPDVVSDVPSVTERARKWLAQARQRAGLSTEGVESSVLVTARRDDPYVMPGGDRIVPHTRDEWAIVMRSIFRGHVFEEELFVDMRRGVAYLLSPRVHAPRLRHRPDVVGVRDSSTRCRVPAPGLEARLRHSGRHHLTRRCTRARVAT